MTWSSANNSVDSYWFFESLIPVMSCFCHLVIISSKYMLSNVGESGQPWRTPLLISTDFESLLLNFISILFFLCKHPLLPLTMCLEYVEISKC